MEEEKARKVVCKTFADWQKTARADKHSIPGKETLGVLHATIAPEKSVNLRLINPHIS